MHREGQLGPVERRAVLALALDEHRNATPTPVIAVRSRLRVTPPFEGHVVLGARSRAGRMNRPVARTVPGRA